MRVHCQQGARSTIASIRIVKLAHKAWDILGKDILDVFDVLVAQLWEGGQVKGCKNLPVPGHIWKVAYTCPNLLKSDMRANHHLS